MNLLHKDFKVFILPIAIALYSTSLRAQMNATFTTTVNTNCNGSGCDYEGPSILINELMISPLTNDGSMSGPGTGAGRGEWIELYNPDLCEPIDISCYYLGNNTNEGNGGFVIPAGTIIPPAGFAMIRGANVPAVPANLLAQNGGNVVEIVVPADITDPGVCSGGTRLWFPNAGGWFAFYDSNGVPQDAVSWASSAGTTGSPCIPTLTGCTAVASLSNYTNIPNDRKNYISAADASTHYGNSLRRVPDGGTWSGNGTPTYATCNATCVQPNSSSCEGTATVNVTGGTPPYSYAWDDSEAQVTQTATALCAGTYTVTVTDNTGQTADFQVSIEDFVPTVTINIQDEICVDGNAVNITVSPVAGAQETGTIQGNGTSGTSFNPQVAGAGNFTITYTFEDEFGCTNSATDQITVNPLPAVSIGNNASPYCLSNVPAALTLTPAGGQLSGPGVSNNQFIPNSAGVGNHTLTYTYTDGNGCSNSTSLSVEVVGSPEPMLIVPAQLCVDAEPVLLQATPSGGTYSINGNPITNNFDPTAAGHGAHTITYSVVDANGCIATTDEVITVTLLPVLDIPVATHYCFDSGYQSVNPSPAGGVLSGVHVNGNGISLTGVEPGGYTIDYSYTDANGCSNATTKTYTVGFPLHPDYEYSTDCFQNATLTALTNGNGYSYAWSANGQQYGFGQQLELNYTTPGFHPIVLTITDEYGCSFDSVGLVDIPAGVSMDDFVVPNVITPNGDGINDVLTMSSLLNECFEYRVIIVNRWGNLVYEMDSNNIVFSGRNKNGDELTAGVYFYSVVSDEIDCDDEQYQGFCFGNITIVR